MTRRDRTGTRRLPGLLVVVVVLALAGVADATMRAHPAPTMVGRAAHGSTEPALAVVSSPVTSTAWYCAGPLPVGRQPQASSIAVANVGDRPARGRLVVTSSRGERRTTVIAVGAHAQAVYGLPRGWTAASAAATVLVDTASVGVEELVHGPNGPMAARCSVEAGHTAYLAEGSTRGAANLALAIYDPGATPAVASVSFATSAGGVTPPAFQGISVAPGGLVVLDVGREVPGQLTVATTVQSTGGRVVVGAAVDAVVGHHLLSSLATASPMTSERWQLAAAPLGATARQGFSILDPTGRSARVTVVLASSSPRAAGSELTAVVPAGAVVDIAPAALAGRSSTGAVVTAAGAPVVVGRELAVAAMPGASEPAASARARRAAPVLLTLPGLPTGFAAAEGTVAPYRRWLLAGGESDARVSEVVTLTDPGSAPAVVRLTTLAGRPVLPALTVAPGTSRVVAVRSIGPSGPLALALQATHPVVAGELLYGAGRRGLGLAAWPGIPVG